RIGLAREERSQEVLRAGGFEIDKGGKTMRMKAGCLRERLGWYFLLMFSAVSTLLIAPAHLAAAPCDADLPGDTSLEAQEEQQPIKESDSIRAAREAAAKRPGAEGQPIDLDEEEDSSTETSVPDRTEDAEDEEQPGTAPVLHPAAHGSGPANASNIKISHEVL